MTVYFNEIDPFCCAVLRRNIELERLPRGFVDERDVCQVRADELIRYRQIHLFAGIGGFAAGFMRAQVPPELRLLTAGFPCQDVSTAGKGAGIEKGTRSGLWREMFRLVRSLRPDWLILENVPALRTRGYDRIADALERIDYAIRPVVVGAWATGTPHRRERVWIVGNAMRERRDRLDALLQPWRPQQDCSQTAGAGAVLACPAHAATKRKRQLHGVGRKPGGAGYGPPPSWPAGPGEPQKEWEAPRVVELAMVGATDGLSRRLVQLVRSNSDFDDAQAQAWLVRNKVKIERAANKHALKAYGNAIVEANAYVIGKWLTEIQTPHPERLNHEHLCSPTRQRL